MLLYKWKNAQFLGFVNRRNSHKIAGKTLVGSKSVLIRYLKKYVISLIL